MKDHSVLCITFRIPYGVRDYFATAAYKRRISRTQLIRSLFDTILEDKLVLSILDDEDKPSTKTKRSRPKAKYNPKLFVNRGIKDVQSPS